MDSRLGINVHIEKWNMKRKFDRFGLLVQLVMHANSTRRAKIISESSATIFKYAHND